MNCNDRDGVTISGNVRSREKSVMSAQDEAEATGNLCREPRTLSFRDPQHRRGQVEPDNVDSPLRQSDPDASGAAADVEHRATPPASLLHVNSASPSTREPAIRCSAQAS